MAKRHIELEIDDELTLEGKRLWESISDYEKILGGITIIPEPEPEIPDPRDISLSFIRTEIRRMIKNSELVIKNCDEIIIKYKTREEYMISDAKIAKSLHANLIIRLIRILNYELAFDHEIDVDNEEPNRLFIDTFKKAL